LVEEISGHGSLNDGGVRAAVNVNDGGIFLAVAEILRAEDFGEHAAGFLELDDFGARGEGRCFGDGREFADLVSGRVVDGGDRHFGGGGGGAYGEGEVGVVGGGVEAGFLRELFGVAAVERDGVDVKLGRVRGSVENDFARGGVEIDEAAIHHVGRHERNAEASGSQRGTS
jgi:hypothetical protein